jgi:hypothetical protein
MEKTNTNVLPAAATFRQQWISPATATFQAAMDIFILIPELLEIRQLDLKKKST